MGRPTQHNHPLGQSGWGRVTMTRVRYAIPESHTRPPRHGAGPGTRGGGHSGRDTPGRPFRTRKLRLPAPMVLHPPGCGRVGHRRPHKPTKGGGPAPRAPSFRLPRTTDTPADTPAHRHAHTDTQHTGHTQQAAYRQGHTTHDTRATAANRASPHSHTTPPPHNPNPTAQRTEGNQTGLARTDPLTPKPHNHRHTGQ